MNKVSYTTGLTVGFDASADVVVLGMLSLKPCLYKIAQRRMYWYGGGLRSIKHSPEHLRNNTKTGIGPILPLGCPLMRRDYTPIILTGYYYIQRAKVCFTQIWRLQVRVDSTLNPPVRLHLALFHVMSGEHFFAQNEPVAF